jgi:hypothetical protein
MSSAQARPIDREARGSERRRSERRPVDGGKGLRQPNRVALERLRVGEDVVSERDRLGLHADRIGRHDRPRMCRRKADERLTCEIQRAQSAQHLVALEKTHAGRVDVLAAAARVQAGSIGAGERDDQLLDLEVVPGAARPLL